MKYLKSVSRRKVAGYGGLGVLIRHDLSSMKIDFSNLTPIEVIEVTVEQMARFGKVN